MVIIRFLQLVLIAATLAACAHTMTLAPDLEKLPATAQSDRIPKNVGVYVSAVDHGNLVTTAGGGGDKVEYHPYADMETGVYRMLSNVFQNVTVLTAPDDAAAIANHQLAYVVDWQVDTTSSSSGVFTWMATDFTVNLTCKINDAARHSVATISAAGSGHADYDELKHNFSLAGQRAALDALIKDQTLLLQNGDLKK